MSKWLAALLASALALMALARALPARADEPAADPKAAAEELFHRAEAEDAAGDYASAIEHYRAAVRALPSLRYAPKAMTRATLLEAHSEGGFAPLKELEAVRRDPRASSDPAAIDALARDAASFPDGPTRGEAWMLCANAYLLRLGRRTDGEAALRRVVGDPRADGLLRREAATNLVRALVDDGDLGAARTTSEADAKWLDPKIAREVTVAARRRWVHRAALADLAVFVGLAAIAVARGSRRRGLAAIKRALGGAWGIGVGFAAYVALAGGVLASEYEAGNATPFIFFGAAILPLAAIARAWSAVGSPSRLARAARSALSASVVLAAAFLVLEAINAQYLEGFHL